jgi:hypothetical protein
MPKKSYHSIEQDNTINRRDFLKIGGLATGAAVSGLVLGNSDLFAQEKPKVTPPAKPKTNIDEALKTPKNKYSLPGPFPGKVVEVHNAKAIVNDKVSAKIVNEMFEKGITKLTGKNLSKSFDLLFTKNDVVGIKVNPVGPGLINTHLEVVDSIISWLTKNGIEKKNIIIWDRFDYMLKDAGYTQSRFPGIGIEGLQTMDEAAAEGKSQDNSKWQTKDGKHISADNFDQDIYYWADVDGPKDLGYLNQHVFNEKHSYFGKLLTKRLTKIINVPVFKNTGNGISMATKNLGYGVICNTGRLHKPLFFDVCTEVLAFPVIRDKLVLNITDGLKGQYDGGPDANSKFIYDFNTLFFATDPFAQDMICHNLLVEKRKSMSVKINENPLFTDYLKYAQKLELGVVDKDKIKHIKV